MTLGKCLDCPASFRSIYGYPSATNPLGTIYNPYHCYYIGFFGSAPITNDWTKAFDDCHDLGPGSSLLRIEPSLYNNYDRSVANFLEDPSSGRHGCIWLDSQSLNTAYPAASYSYTNGYPVPASVPWGGGCVPSPAPSQSCIIYHLEIFKSYCGITFGWCNTICQYGV